jgi:hypothetical protein
MMSRLVPAADGVIVQPDPQYTISSGYPRLARASGARGDSEFDLNEAKVIQASGRRLRSGRAN